MIDTTIDQCRSNGFFLRESRSAGLPWFFLYRFRKRTFGDKWQCFCGLREETNEVCDAWSGRRPTYGYLPSRGASRPLTVAKLHCFVDRDTYEHVYSPER